MDRDSADKSRPWPETQKCDRDPGLQKVSNAVGFRLPSRKALTEFRRFRVAPVGLKSLKWHLDEAP